MEWKIRGVRPQYDPENAHIVRRLGAAVIEKWDDLPVAVRNVLREQAVFMEDDYKTVQLAQQVDSFIRRNKGWPASPGKPE